MKTNKIVIYLTLISSLFINLSVIAGHTEAAPSELTNRMIQEIMESFDAGIIAEKIEGILLSEENKAVLDIIRADILDADGTIGGHLIESLTPEEVKNIHQVATDTSKTTFAKEKSIKLSSFYGFAENQGKRPSMQDEHIIQTGDGHIFFGIFDGHGKGKEVATHLKNYLYQSILTKINYGIDPLTAFAESCIEVNNTIGEIGSDRGSAATFALIKDNHIYTGNVGDSRIVLSQNGAAIDLTSDQKPDRPDERARIEGLGGTVTIKPGKTTARVNNRLALSRSFGDFHSRKYITPNPEVADHEINIKDEFIILACDGVWDAITSQQAVEIVKTALVEHQLSPEDAAKYLIETAIYWGSTDNVSAIVVNLRL